MQLSYSQELYKRITITNPNFRSLQNLSNQGIDLTCGAIQTSEGLQLELSEHELQNVSNLGVPYRVLVDDLTKYYADRAQKNLPHAKQELQSQKYSTAKAGFGKSSVSNILFDNLGQYNGCDEINWSTPTN
ncbi:hypothetical protein, partial [Hyunsoonleella aestuarii]|uniref:hypothetical protein n=1 Tax=Hyunsoonleella aestuarii TaxID=912802 RepID=UPI0011114907